MKALLIVFLFFSAYISSPSRTFTSSDGLRTIDATLLTVNEASKTITIRRSDGKSFHANLSAFSYSDQAYARQWLKGKKENYLLVGREYPSHLKIYLRLLESGQIGYGEAVPSNHVHSLASYGYGQTPFLAWVQGYDQLGQEYKRINAKRVSFDLVHGSWQAWIAFRKDTYSAVRSMKSYPSTVTFPSITRVNGPILYQQPQQVIYLNQNHTHKPVIVLPRGFAPAYLNSFGEGLGSQGLGGSLGGWGISSNSFSRGGSLAVRIAR